VSEKSRTQAAEAYLTAVERLKAKVQHLEAVNERLREELAETKAELKLERWPGERSH
jgi:chaperonin cofactor prefoldin